MADEYWIVVEGRRWKRVPWFKRRTFFNKICEYDTVKFFVETLIKDYPDETIRLGVTRGKDIYLL